jgi:two-component system phosphate regulon sensor histidine kinase PhoR
MTSGLMAGSDGHGRGFRRIVLLLIWLVIVPTALLLAVGILLLVMHQQLNVLFGILVVTLVGCVVTGGVLALVFLRREAKLSKLQLDFVSKVSHELRTPLTSIRMFTEMLQAEGRSVEETETCLRVLQQETGRLSDRIERLLDWGRMEAGRRVYEHRPDEVGAVVDEAVKAFGAVQLGNKVQVAVEVADDLPTILADRHALVDALVNLLTNAVKYSDEDKRITVSASADARTIRIAVRDNGMGIARAELSRIFQKFYRVDDRLARAVEGSGLGLAIVRHVALGHGGKVEVDSEPGRGSTFTIVLPRPDERALQQAQELSAAAEE